MFFLLKINNGSLIRILISIFFFICKENPHLRHLFEFITFTKASVEIKIPGLRSNIDDIRTHITVYTL